LFDIGGLKAVVKTMKKKQESFRDSGVGDVMHSEICSLAQEDNIWAEAVVDAGCIYPCHFGNKFTSKSS
jgi:hypothetical protein